MRRLCSWLMALVLPAACGDGGAAVGASALDDAAPTTVPLASAVAYGAVYVVNGGSNSVTVINSDANEVAGTIALHGVAYPHHIYLSPDASRVVVAVPGIDFSNGHASHLGITGGPRGTVLVLDALTGALQRSVRLDASNHNATFTRDGSEIWTGLMGTPGRVLVLDPVTLATREQFVVGAAPGEVTFSADGTRAFVAAMGSNQITVVDTASKRVVRTLDVGRDPVGAWQGSNGLAYVDNESDGSLSTIDTRALDVVGTSYLGFVPGMIAYGPDQNVWVADPNGSQVVLRANDAVVARIPTGAGAHGIVFRADGKLAYVSNQDANTVTVIDVTTRTATKTLLVGSKPNGMVARAR